MARLYRDNPGPGQYTPKPAIGTGFRATLRSRVTVRSLHKTPSSADYEVGAPLGKQVRGDLRSAPAFSLGSRPKKGGLPIGSDAPGPGTYAVNAKTRSGKHPLSTVKSQPAFSMASRPPVVKHEWDSQGPGQSRTDSGFGKQVHGMQRSNPAFSMGCVSPAAARRGRCAHPLPVASPPQLAHDGRQRVDVHLQRQPGAGGVRSVAVAGRDDVVTQRDAALSGEAAGAVRHAQPG